MDLHECRHISQIIFRHAHRLPPDKRNAFLQKALQQWANAVNDDPLPVAPNREPGEWVKKTDAINERQNTTGPADKDRKKKAKSKTRLVLKPPKEGNDKPLSPTTKIIEKLDGTQWLQQIDANGKVTIRQLGKYRTPVYQEQRTDQKQPQPEKEADKKEETKEMKKSEKTLQRWGRNRTFADIQQDTAGVQLAQPQPQSTAAVPFGHTALSAAMTGKQYTNLSGHQQAAVRAGLSPDHPGLASMTADDMRQAVQQHTLDIANAGRSRLGLPPIELQPEKDQAATFFR